MNEEEEIDDNTTFSITPKGSIYLGVISAVPELTREQKDKIVDSVCACLIAYMNQFHKAVLPQDNRLTFIDYEDK